VKSLDVVFVITVAFYVLAIVSGIFVKNINIKPPKKEKKDVEEKEEEELEGKTATPSIVDGNNTVTREKQVESVVEAKGEIARAEGV